MGVFNLDDTIAAVATPLGEGGIGIVKISGPAAVEILHRLFSPASPSIVSSDFRPRQLRWGYIRDPHDGSIVDEVLAVVMPAPHSYTRQDVVEIQSHGGILPVRRILELVLTHGARLAEPGEMTLRAFLNGRIDLAQAEAVLDIVRARTESALRVAVAQLGGRLSARVRPVRTQLLNILAYLEASIDFTEDEIPIQDIITPLNAVANALAELLNTADRGMIYRYGIRAAIVGRPNVGKSSLLNALLRGDRAIVTPIPGTTRDTLEETVNLQGVPLILVDTAGIRAHPQDEVERLGVERSRAALRQADLALLVLDGSCPLEAADFEIAALIGERPALVVINKSDLPPRAETDALLSLLPSASLVRISALTGEGIAELENAILEKVLGGQVLTADIPLVSNARHKAALSRAREHVLAAIEGHHQGLSADLVAIDVREAMDALGEITGETATTDLLETIFSQFCIGK
ncbi:MAG: tRNA uridine-5-carboxymethylaminomethyl(34) synthesis GTPase MnmE [Anaerolineae bacterium]|nr:tRNA uridine-5-carboxymethylaminomethyl(34) synthesis GTPase MnmE [Anaerolineae bacterium]MDW8070768.1 tRNA uridine-5-carboxymethylaminomethyl(34) synthesis GTPase MnmE [Anaerolineae bacterium]